MRLIDADALLEKVQFRLPAINTHFELANKFVEITRRLISEEPTIDPEELRPTGEWKYKWDAERDPKRLFVRIVCSECNLHTGQKSNYCPNCGCRMNGGNE